MITEAWLVQKGYTINVIQKLRVILSKIPRNYTALISKSKVTYITACPKPYMIVNGVAIDIGRQKSKAFYKVLISDKVILSRGLLHWCQELALSDTQINTCFTFAKKCTTNVFKQVFQHKIGVNITPTNEYLFRYQVLGNNKCTRCQDGEVDTVIHSLWDCCTIQPFIAQVLEIVAGWTGREEIDMVEYLFGLNDADNEGTNHYLLEAKLLHPGDASE